jgi:ribosomal protein L34E
MSVAHERPHQTPAPDADSSHVRRSKVPLRCAECGYEIGSYSVLPPCPMCREFSWEPAPWRPFTRPRAA